MSLPAKPRRLTGLDAARGVAVLAMFAFHFIWDLGHFGYIDADFPYSLGVKAFGHAIALAFLFIAGVSLVLAQENGAGRRSLRRRLALVCGAAALVSAGTYLAFPQAFVFFGILHCIAAASLLAGPLLFLPWPAALIAAALAGIAPFVASNASFDAPIWWWTGLSTFTPITNDYRPLFPWAGALFLGVAAMKFWRVRGGAGGLPRPGFGERVGARGLPRPGCGERVGVRGQWAFARFSTKPLALLGRHSLPLYLVHQPLFFTGFSALALLTATPAADDARGFIASCETQCAGAGGAAATCRAACDCTAAEVSRRDALSNVADDAERARRIGEIARECLAKGP